ncbi:MAG: hypothetical protein VKK80_17070 [Prochlorothrix sp.]|nr:hypothetical protein [Prochlorothrix sp.]
MTPLVRQWKSPKLDKLGLDRPPPLPRSAPAWASDLRNLSGAVDPSC